MQGGYPPKKGHKVMLDQLRTFSIWRHAAQMDQFSANAFSAKITPTTG